MGIGGLCVFTLVLATVSSHSLDDPWLRDPLFVGLWKLTKAINSFGLFLFDYLAVTEDGNLVICPYSLSTPLGILHFGARGDTEKELSIILGYDLFNLTKEEAAQTFYLLSTKHLKSSNPKFYTLEVPATIIVNRKNGMLPTFQRTVEVLFQAPITVADFVGGAEKMIRSINKWVADRTRRKITHIIDSVDTYTDMIILSAAYFKGVWKYKFPPAETKSNIFYNFGERDKAKSVPMMRIATALHYHRGHQHSILELPFKGRNVSMLILLPNELDGINDLVYKFTPEFLEDMIFQMMPTEVEVLLPKFKFRYAADLSDLIRGMGAHILFDPEKIDLSHMIRRDSITFEEINHHVVVSVGENGVEAAAATSILRYRSVNSESKIPNFHVNRPFLFVIYERRIKMVLFLGRVTNL